MSFTVKDGGPAGINDRVGVLIQGANCTYDTPGSPISSGDIIVQDDETSAPQPECSDGLDNDGDGRIDHPADRQCESPSDPSERSQCDDDLDNDGDGDVDYPDDPGCQSARDNSEAPNPQCSDGVDNDGDGRTDHPDDPGCRSARDTSEDSDNPPTAT
jgi:hypothetical protein